MKSQGNNVVSIAQLRIVWIFLSISIIIGILSIGYNYTHTNKIVYVDALSLVSKYQGMKDATIEFEGKKATYSANLDTLKMEFDEKVREYDLKKPKLSSSERKLFEELLGSKEQQLVNYKQMVQDKMQNENVQLTQRVLEKINEYVKRFGEEKGYELILAATQQGNIIYGTPDVNITEQIIAGLNSEYQSGTKK